MFDSPSTIALRRLLLILLFGAVAGVMGVNAFDSERSERRDMLERQSTRLGALNERLARDNIQRRASLNALERGAEGWRDLARQTHGMLAEGEVLFRFPTNPR